MSKTAEHLSVQQLDDSSGLPWFAYIGGLPRGPMSFEALQARVAAGEVRPHDLVMHADMSDWIKAAEVSVLGLGQPGPARATPPPLRARQATASHLRLVVDNSRERVTQPPPPPMPRGQVAQVDPAVLAERASLQVPVPAPPATQPQPRPRSGRRELLRLGIALGAGAAIAAAWFGLRHAPQQDADRAVADRAIAPAAIENAARRVDDNEGIKPFVVTATTATTRSRHATRRRRPSALEALGKPSALLNQRELPGMDQHLGQIATDDAPRRPAPRAAAQAIDAPSVAERTVSQTIEREVPRQARGSARRDRLPADRVVSPEPAVRDTAFSRVDAWAALAQKLWRRNARGLVACDKMAERRGYIGHVNAEFKVNVDADGKLDTLEIRKADHLPSSLKRCYRAFVSRWPYPDKGQSYTLAFRKL